MSKAFRLLEKIFEVKGVTSNVNKHTHEFEVDSSGLGWTTSTSPTDHPEHKHKIEDFEVLEENGHNHGKIKKRG